MVDSARIISNSPAETIAIGRGLGILLQPGDIVCLVGGLGAGKTCFARGIAMGLGVDASRVTSPTFVLAQEYAGRIPVYHLDLYRLRSAEDVEDAGLDEYIGGDGVLVIEWPQVYSPLLGIDRLTVKLGAMPADESQRELVFVARGDRYRGILKEMKLC